MFFPAGPSLALGSLLARRGSGDWRARWPDGAMVFARARFALREGLVALAAHHALRRVWLPAFLCGPVPEAVRAAGLEPVLYDLDAHLVPRLDAVTPARGDAFLVVHYFGLVGALPGVRAFCAGHAVPLVEDCAHALPDVGRAGAGSAGAVSVWSLRKLGPLPGGGLLVVRDPAVRRRIAAPAPSRVPDARTLGRCALMLAERAADALGVNPMPLKNRLPVLDASHGGIDEVPPPAAGAGTPPPARLIHALLERTDWSAIAARRRESHRRLAAALEGVPGLTVAEPRPDAHSVPEACAVLVDDPRGVAVRLRARGVEAMPWPGAEQFAFDRRRFPGAADWCDRTLCLPLGTSSTASRVDRLAEIVRDVVARPRGDRRPPWPPRRRSLAAR